MAGDDKELTPEEALERIVDLSTDDTLVDELLVISDVVKNRQNATTKIDGKTIEEWKTEHDKVRTKYLTTFKEYISNQNNTQSNTQNNAVIEEEKKLTVKDLPMFGGK